MTVISFVQLLKSNILPEFCGCGTKNTLTMLSWSLQFFWREIDEKIQFFMYYPRLLTLNKPGFSGHLKAGGGRNQPGYVIDVLHCGFWFKSLFYGLKWKFRSSVVHRTNNHSSMLDSFAVRLLGSNLLLSWKFASFG